MKQSWNYVTEAWLYFYRSLLAVAGHPVTPASHPPPLDEYLHARLDIDIKS
jgi:hypothetical protein